MPLGKPENKKPLPAINLSVDSGASSMPMARVPRNGRLAHLDVAAAKKLPPLEIKGKALPPIGGAVHQFVPHPPAEPKPVKLDEVKVSVPEVKSKHDHIPPNNAVHIISVGTGNRKELAWVNPTGHLTAPIDMFPACVTEETLSELHDRFAAEFMNLDFGTHKIKVSNTIKENVASLAAGRTLSSYTLHDVAFQIHKAVLADDSKDFADSKTTINNLLNCAYLVLTHLQATNQEIINPHVQKQCLDQLLLLSGYTNDHAEIGLFKLNQAPNFMKPYSIETLDEARSRYQREFQTLDVNEVSQYYPNVRLFLNSVTQYVIGEPMGAQHLKMLCDVAVKELDQSKAHVDSPGLIDLLSVNDVRLAKTATVAFVMNFILDEAQKTLDKTITYPMIVKDAAKTAVEIGILRDTIAGHNPKPESYKEERFYSRF